MKTDIILAGVGGQGILTIATILGRAAMQEDLNIKQAEVHGMSQRGGDVQSNLRISSSPIASDLIPTGAADIIVSLEPMEALRYVPSLSTEEWIVTSTAPFNNIPDYPETGVILDELSQWPHTIAFDMEEMAREVANPRASNMVLLGACTPLTGIDADKIEAAIRAVFAAKGDAIVESNIKAFNAGMQKALEIMKA